MDWHEGYVSDIDYLAEFFPEQSPTLLSFACILNGIEPVPLDRPFTYFELGSGQGFTANILAAANPQGDFYAADFNPAHVAASCELAQAAELDNMHFLESSFADLAAGRVALPQFDFITLHGVYTWVNADNRAHIVRFMERYLKPGGVVYLSYNAMPGWTTTLPLQRLILEHVDLYPGSRHEQIVQMRRLVTGLSDNQAAYFTGNASANLRNYLDAVMDGDASWSSYIAHEYMNHGWQPLYHADVARDVAAAKLDYAGSACLPWAFPKLYLTPQQSTLLASIPDPALRETVLDYLKNTCFRKDVYVRGARRMSAARTEQWLAKIGVALVSLRETVSLEMRFPVRQLVLERAEYDPLLDALAEGPKTLLELAALPALAGKGLHGVAEMVALLAETRHASVYFLSAAGLDTAPARRMNDAVAQNERLNGEYRVFASPLLGSGVKAPLFQRLVYQSLSAAGAGRAGSSDAGEIAAQVWQRVKEQQQPVILGERELHSEDEAAAEIRATVQAILQRRQPIWRDLRILQD